jgi:hypothetical protein
MDPTAIVRAVALSGIVLGIAGQSSAEAPSLSVSEDRRSLVTGDGSSFFWLKDTAWELFHRLDRDQAPDT